jgi:hypothetical protein
MSAGLQLRLDPAGKVVSLKPLESFVGMHYDSQSPYLGYLLARVTEMCIGKALDGKDAIEDGGDPAPYAQALRTGFRGQQAIGWLMHTIKANHNNFVRLCLAGLSLLGTLKVENPSKSGVLRSKVCTTLGLSTGRLVGS